MRVFIARRRLTGRELARPFAGNQVQAPGLVRAFRAAGTCCAAVPFVNQPHLRARKIGTHHGPGHELPQQLHHGLLVCDIQQYFRCVIRVEPTVTDWLHNNPILPNPEPPVELYRDDFSHVRIFDHYLAWPAKS
jgi:hypothetical protein